MPKIREQTLEERHRRILELKELKQDWCETQKGADNDRWGGPVSPRALATAHVLLDAVHGLNGPLPHIYANPLSGSDPESGVEFEWDVRRNGVLCAGVLSTVMPSGVIESIYVVHPKPEHGLPTYNGQDEDYDTDDVNTCARWIVSKLGLRP
jgi:hypothetical protein